MNKTTAQHAPLFEGISDEHLTEFMTWYRDHSECERPLLWQLRDCIQEHFHTTKREAYKLIQRAIDKGLLTVTCSEVTFHPP